MLFLAFKYSCDSAPFNSDLSTDQQSLEWMRLISRAISCEFMIKWRPSSISLMNCQNISIVLLSFKYIPPFYPPQVFSHIFHRCDPASTDHLTQSSNTLRHWHFQDTKVITRLRMFFKVSANSRYLSPLVTPYYWKPKMYQLS